MRRLFICLTAVLSLSVAQAGVQPPQDQRGNALTTIDWVGASVSNIDTSTGTASVIVLTGRGIVYGVTASSITNTQYLVFRDTATANLTSSTATVVFANGSNASASGASTTLTIKFAAPIKFTNGICVVASAAPAGVSNWTIHYRPMLATE